MTVLFWYFRCDIKNGSRQVLDTSNVLSPTIVTSTRSPVIITSTRSQAIVTNTSLPRTDTSPPTNNILVIILGETRAYKHTFDKFKKHVLDALGADLALCVADKTLDNNPFYTHARYHWLYPDVEDWSEAFEFAARSVYYKEQYATPGTMHWKEILRVKDQFMGGVKGKGEHKGSAGILLFMRWWLWRNIKDTVLNHYDWFIVTRSDYYYLANHTNTIFAKKDVILIVEGEDYGGVTDRHAVLSRNMLYYWLDFVDALMKDTRGMIKEMGKGNWNLEAVLKWRLQKNNVWNKVHRFPQVMFTVRDKDTRTRWSKGNFNRELGLFVKYPDEYNRAKRNSKIKH